MAHRVRSALAWSVASLLPMGVLVQGAVLLRFGVDASFGVVAAVAVASGVAVALVAYVIEPRFEREERA